ncbi:hypothetical protein A176_007752 [Myxococcus hansupus]|uniref:Uncharacterized protein n=1 Tax=Pseudomyxococcus hansupus TaxID=1297742 RepID=A0A0H4XAW9_9BACT|nr:hypothetical protein [Myxococcus hansupus]AKQ70840.1 hypothetical protein A176_007752 [Myxococcus hansupus]
MSFQPPIIPATEVPAALRERGYAVLGRDGLCELAGLVSSALDALPPSWNDLPLDGFLRDGGRYRSRGTPASSWTAHR